MFNIGPGAGEKRGSKGEKSCSLPNTFVVWHRLLCFQGIFSCIPSPIYPRLWSVTSNWPSSYISSWSVHFWDRLRCSLPGGGVFLGILVGSVTPGNSNPDPISDQKIKFSTPVFRLDLSNLYSFSDLAFRQKLCYHYLAQSVNKKIFISVSNSQISLSLNWNGKYIHALP